MYVMQCNFAVLKGREMPDALFITQILPCLRIRPIFVIITPMQFAFITTILPPPKVVRWLMHPYHPHFCYRSWLPPPQATIRAAIPENGL